MKYYKIIQGEKIIDAIADPCWVKQNENNLIVRCEPNEAMGIVSSDMSTILHISGTKEFSDGNEYQDVFVADISAEEYDELVVLLGLGAAYLIDWLLVHACHTKHGCSDSIWSVLGME